MIRRQAFSLLPRRWRLIDQPLFVQFIVAGGLVGAVSFASLVILLTQVQNQNEVSHRLARSHQAIERLGGLGSNIYRQRGAIFDFVSSEQKFSLESIGTMRLAWEREFLSVRSLVSNNQTQKLGLDHLRKVYLTWLSLTQRFIQSSGTIGATDLRSESALLKDIVVTVDRLIDSEAALLILRVDQEKFQIRTTFLSIAGINLVLLIIFGIILTNLYFSIARPLFDLLRGISRYQDGNFGVRVPVANRSQVGFLIASFNEMAEKIENMLVDLQKLDEMKTEFLSTVSHELRTPLTSIGGYAKLLLTGDAGPVTDTQQGFLKIIHTNAIRLTHLINDILDAEALEVGKVQIVKESLNLVPILKECCDTFRIVAQQKGLEIRCQLPDTPIAVLGERGRLIQIFMNLMSNAIKYTQSGFVEVEIEQSDIVVTVRVRDTGVGLSTEDQGHLFQKFYRSRSGIESKEGGTGLGLVIVRGLVEAHAGEISVRSQLGKGTEFTINLPATYSAHVGLAETTAPKKEIRKVWVLESKEADRKLIRQFLENFARRDSPYALEIRIFENLGEVPEVVEMKDAPAIVIVDEFSSIPAMRKKIHKMASVLLMSADVDTGVAFAEGASAILTKPISEHEFTVAIQDFLTVRGWHILIVDHNSGLRILLKHELEQKGIHADDMDHGNLVLGRLQQEYYDLVLIDMDLPDVSGIELIKAIRKNDRFEELPIFLMAEDVHRAPSADDLQKRRIQRLLGKQDGISGIVAAVSSYLEEKTHDRKD
jgi:signal transduction histidine kinase/CheY-like chemotaxis protein